MGFRELYVEFVAMVNFEEQNSDLRFNQALALRPGGIYRECSILEFAWRMGLYTEDET